MKHLLIIILTAFILTGCSKEDDITNDILGNWKWDKSSGGIDGRTETPQTTGNSILLVISNGSIKKYVNGNLKTNLAYSIQTGKSIRGGQREIIVYENDWKQSIELNGNQLILYDECYDCFQNEYVKE